MHSYIHEAITEMHLVIRKEKKRKMLESFTLTQGPGIRGTQVKSSGNKNHTSSSRRLDGAYFSETPPSWHVRPHFSLIAIVNY